MPEFCAYWTYWLIVVVALALCAALGYRGGLYVAHEAIVVFYSWRPSKASKTGATTVRVQRERTDRYA